MPMQRKIRHRCRDKKILSMHVSSFVDIFLLILNPIIKVEHKSFNFLIFPIFLEHYHGVLWVKMQFMVKKDNNIGWTTWMCNRFFLLFYVFFFILLYYNTKELFHIFSFLLNLMIFFIFISQPYYFCMYMDVNPRPFTHPHTHCP